MKKTTKSDDFEHSTNRLNTKELEKENELVIWLQRQQNILQDEWKKRISINKSKFYDIRGVWISVRCVCGNDFKTPYHLRHNGRCQKCGRLFYRLPTKEVSNDKKRT